MKHILVVDDDAVTRTYLRSVLEKAGYEVSEAHNALEVLGQSSPDLMILDIKMPGIDGVRVCSAYKKDKTFRGRILVLTGLKEPRYEEAALAAGADGFLTKPVDREVLLDEVVRLLGTASFLSPRPDSDPL